MSQVSGGDFLVNLGTSLVLALLSFVAGWAATNARSRQKLGYIRRPPQLRRQDHRRRQPGPRSRPHWV